MHFEWPQSLTQQDMERMVALMNTVSLRETTLGFYEEIPLEAGLAMMRSLAVEIEKGVSHLLLVRNDEGLIVGMLTVAPHQHPARRHVVEMRRCVIDPDYRGGFILSGFAHALKKAQSLGCDMIVLEVRGDAKAERLWRRMGFKEYGKLEDYARVHGRSLSGYYLYAYLKDLLEYREQNGSSLHRLESQQ
jgi:GNAT superfamily N-acetyltransferase